MSLGANRVAMLAASNASAYMEATGGTVTTDGDYKVHTFTGDGTFEVTKLGNTGTIDIIIVGGGGGGAAQHGGGGGAGGYRSFTGESVTETSYSIVIGGGGSGGSWPRRRQCRRCPRPGR